MYKLLRSFLVLSLILLIGSVALAAEPKVLKYRISETDTLDPAQAGSEESAVITTAIYESLVQGTRDGRLLPALAESWTVSDDFRTITFKLRKGVTFHDGTPFNAEAVKYNWDRTFKIQKVGIGNMLTACDADSFRVVDEYTFQVVLAQAVAPFRERHLQRWLLHRQPHLHQEASYRLRSHRREFSRQPRLRNGAF